MQQTEVLDFTRNSTFSRTVLIGVLVLITCLFAGCASNTPLISPAPRSSHSNEHHSYRHNAPYNRPYRVRGRTYYPMRSAAGYSEYGIASWYGSESGNRTAMGSRFRPNGLTAAHKTLPLPTKVRVTNLRNGRSVDVLVNDRGPFKKGRVIDLSHGAAKQIGLHGVAKVKIEYLSSN
ncbi:MAG: septal ring lytic transglycosylase RlpA family protein [Methylococcaceae bacterium]|nr:septal ring lytic transglycosylase RlpA family protein [Methylococcaceae bacterium]